MFGNYDKISMSQPNMKGDIYLYHFSLFIAFNYVTSRGIDTKSKIYEINIIISITDICG